MGPHEAAPRDRARRLPDREAEALEEIARTRGGCPSRVATIVGFVAIALFGVAAEIAPLGELKPLKGRRQELRLPTFAQLSGSWRARGWSGVQARLERAIRQVDRYTERDSAAVLLLQAPLQRALVNAFRYGNGQVIVGREDWLFFQGDFHHTVGPPFLDPAVLEQRRQPGARLYPARDPDPVPGLLELGRQLRRHRSQLVLFPVPDKVEIYPERLSPGDWQAPPRNPSMATLVERLEAGGVLVYDPTVELFALARDQPDLYLPSDSHWTPAAIARTASGLARFIGRRVELPAREPVGFRRRRVRVQDRVEMERLIGFPLSKERLGGRTSYPATEILWPDGRGYRAREARGDVVLLGDSFSMVYSLGAGGRAAAGLPAHLAAELDRPVQLIAATQRNELFHRTRWLAERPKLLGRARVVVYEIASRFLSTANWTPGELTAHRKHRRARPRRGAASKETR